MPGRPDENRPSPAGAPDGIAALTIALGQRGEPRAVHDARVALRRVATALSLLRSSAPASLVDGAAGDIRWLRRALAPARALDALLADVIPALRKRAPEEAALDRLREAAEHRRAQLLAAVSDVGSDERSRALLEAGAALTRDWRAALSPALARQALRAPYAKLCKAAKKLKAADDDGLHRLRIRVRGLRYLGEHLAAVLPEREWRTLRKSLVRLQDALGGYNDAVEAPALAQELARSAPPELDRAALDRAAALIAGWSIARRDHLRAGLPLAWDAAEKRAAKLLAKLEK